MTIPASPAAPCGFCGLLSRAQQMIYVDTGPPGDALWLVAYGNLWTPLATVALSLTQLQGTDPAGASQLCFPGSPCLDISDVEIKEPVFTHRTGNTQWKGCRHKSTVLFCTLGITLTLLCGERTQTHTEK